MFRHRCAMVLLLPLIRPSATIVRKGRRVFFVNLWRCCKKEKDYSRNARLKILPTLLLGKLLRNSMSLGTL